MHSISSQAHIKTIVFIPLLLSFSSLYALSSTGDIAASVVTIDDAYQVNDQIAAAQNKLFLQLSPELGEMGITPISDNYSSSKSSSRLLIGDATMIPSLDATTLFTSDGIASFQSPDPADAEVVKV